MKRYPNPDWTIYPPHFSILQAVNKIYCLYANAVVQPSVQYYSCYMAWKTKVNTWCRYCHFCINAPMWREKRWLQGIFDPPSYVCMYNGLQEHVFCLKNSITDFRHQSGKLYFMFLDLADAFRSIAHEMMVNALRAIGYPEVIINLTKDIYTDSTFQVDTNSGLTDPIVRHRGIIQDCPYSVIAFEQGIDIM